MSIISIIAYMAMDAVAVYLREIRRGRGLTQEALAEAVGVSKRTIERVERNEGDITVPTFTRMIVTIHASPDDVTYLATANVTPEEGRDLAQSWLQGTGRQKELPRQNGTQVQTGHTERVMQVLIRLRELEAEQLFEVLDVISTLLRAKWVKGGSGSQD